MMKPVMIPFFGAMLAFSGTLQAQDAEVEQPTQEQNQGNQNNQNNQNNNNNNANSGDTDGPLRFWQATLPGGHYMVALDRIATISRHKYILDGGMVIDEVTIDASGQSLARFYVVSPITAAAPGNAAAAVIERSRALIDASAQQATGSELQNMVVKNYPTTSHARTVEYRIMTEAQLSSLYTSLRGAWESGRGRQFTSR